jgi:hypothetical protein
VVAVLLQIVEVAVTGNWQELRGDDLPIKVYLARAPNSLSGIADSIRRMVLDGREPATGPHVTCIVGKAER